MFAGACALTFLWSEAPGFCPGSLITSDVQEPLDRGRGDLGSALGVSMLPPQAQLDVSTVVTSKSQGLRVT